jgi:hypothetical protein
MGHPPVGGWLFIYNMAAMRKNLAHIAGHLLVFMINLLFNAPKPSHKELRHH